MSFSSEFSPFSSMGIDGLSRERDFHAKSTTPLTSSPSSSSTSSSTSVHSSTNSSSFSLSSLPSPTSPSPFSAALSQMDALQRESSHNSENSFYQYNSMGQTQASPSPPPPSSSVLPSPSVPEDFSLFLSVVLLLDGQSNGNPIPTTHLSAMLNSVSPSPSPKFSLLECLTVGSSSGIVVLHTAPNGTGQATIVGISLTQRGRSVANQFTQQTTQSPQSQQNIQHSQSQSQSVSPLPPMSPSSSSSSASLSSASSASPSSVSSSSSVHPAELSPSFNFPLPMTPLDDKYYKHENHRHLQYIFHFRVHQCEGFLQRNCPAESKKIHSPTASCECFDFHNPKMRRRIPRPVAYSNGVFWNYNACRCQAMEREGKCEKGDACRYSHAKEEIAYHPSRYKTQLCSYVLRSDGTCSRFGAHCAFAHSEEDMRKPIVLKQGMPNKQVDDSPIQHPMNSPFSQNPSSNSSNGPLNSSQNSQLSPLPTDGQAPRDSRRPSTFISDRERSDSDGNSPSFPSSSPNAPLLREDFICPTENLLNDRQYYLYQYKCSPCHQQTAECAKGICENYHYDNKRRRNPSQYAYAHEPCPNVKHTDTGGWKRPSCCPLSDACLLAHTLLEAMYHPTVYKSVMCSNFNETDMNTWTKCSWGRQCSHAHSREELEFNECCIKYGNPPSNIPPSEYGNWAKSAGNLSLSKSLSSQSQQGVPSPSSQISPSPTTPPSNPSFMSADPPSPPSASLGNPSNISSPSPTNGQFDEFGGAAPSTPKSAKPDAEIFEDSERSLISSSPSRSSPRHGPSPFPSHSHAVPQGGYLASPAPLTLAEWGREKAEMSKKLSTQHTEILQLKQYLKEEQQNQTAQKTELANLKRRLQQLLEEKSANSHQIRQIQSESAVSIESLQSAIGTLRWEFSALQDEKKSVENEMRRLQRADAEKAALQKENRILQEEIRRLQSSQQNTQNSSPMKSSPSPSPFGLSLDESHNPWKVTPSQSSLPLSMGGFSGNSPQSLQSLQNLQNSVWSAMDKNSSVGGGGGGLMMPNPQKKMPSQNLGFSHFGQSGNPHDDDDLSHHLDLDALRIISDVSPSTAQ